MGFVFCFLACVLLSVSRTLINGGDSVYIGVVDKASGEKYRRVCALYVRFFHVGLIRDGDFVLTTSKMIEVFSSLFLFVFVAAYSVILDIVF
jgi:hypothetical protein